MSVNSVLECLYFIVSITKFLWDIWRDVWKGHKRRTAKGGNRKGQR